MGMITHPTMDIMTGNAVRDLVQRMRERLGNVNGLHGAETAPSMIGINTMSTDIRIITPEEAIVVTRAMRDIGQGAEGKRTIILVTCPGEIALTAARGTTTADINDGSIFIPLLEMIATESPMTTETITTGIPNTIEVTGTIPLERSAIMAIAANTLTTLLSQDTLTLISTEGSITTNILITGRSGSSTTAAARGEMTMNLIAREEAALRKNRCFEWKKEK